MELFSTFADYGWGLVRIIVSFLFVLTIVVFFHELGHFLAARWRGVTVKVFSVGFGPELFGFTDRKGTRWRFSAIPLGGYVRFLGDENEASVTDRGAIEQMAADVRAGAFASKSIGSRATIVAAGPIASFILAIVIFTAFFSIFGRPEIIARVDSVDQGSPAERAGFQVGDVVIGVDGRRIRDFTDLQRTVAMSGGEPLEIEVERGLSVLTLRATPELKQADDIVGKSSRMILGIKSTPKSDEILTRRFSVLGAAKEAIHETWAVVSQTVVFIYQLIGGRASSDQLGGPVKIAQISGEVSNLGLLPLISFAAYLSIGIGLINLFPVPLLDGGHLLYYAIEAVRGRPLSDAAQEFGFRLGLLAILALTLFTFVQDTKPVWSRAFT